VKGIEYRYRLELDPAKMARAGRVPSRITWSGSSPTTTNAALVTSIRKITTEAPVRRTTTEILDGQSAQLAGILLSAGHWYDWLCRHGRDDTADLMKQWSACRGELKAARAALRKARSRKPTPEALHRALFRATAAKLLAEAAGERFNSQRSGLPEPPRRHRLSFASSAALTVVHELFYDYGLPDSAVSNLLKAVGIPAPSPRNIKRLRTSFRRP
jgi:hypothetical protein